MAAPSECVPGQRICRFEEDYLTGHGTYVRNNYIHATLAGYVQVNTADDGKTCIEVRTKKEKNVVPSVGSVVTVRIMNVNPRFCRCAILCVANTTMKHSFRGMIRKEDVRATEKDRVEMYKCFRPGDIVLARVLSLGDAQSYTLSTAENELGVVIAKSEAGDEMVPINWCEMQCPKTLTKENRKVAKVDIERQPGT
ncbi:exosome complex component CSL4-like isoform X2 [Lineus longissimus]|uniref:exosome complex component CSL4-like isoform X2 n=1 Tax=Lineus longissimus TaxID=88925 RepID=UPI002B4FA4BF